MLLFYSCKTRVVIGKVIGNQSCFNLHQDIIILKAKSSFFNRKRGPQKKTLQCVLGVQTPSCAKARFFTSSSRHTRTYTQYQLRIDRILDDGFGEGQSAPLFCTKRLFSQLMCQSHREHSLVRQDANQFADGNDDHDFEIKTLDVS